MSTNFLHEYSEFQEVINVVANELGVIPVLVEKDYWIMHCLYGLQSQGLSIYLKGGTSLSKGFKILNRFSEDIDILIEPPADLHVATGKNQDKKAHQQSRKDYYDWLSQSLSIPGILNTHRDSNFDDGKYRSGGIRLEYPSRLSIPADIKQGILLEVGFDQITPNIPLTISSWAYDKAYNVIELKDNRAIDVPCYHPGYTLVEKLQTISTKYRKQQAQGTFSENFMRHYYDVFNLLDCKEVQDFVGSKEYLSHKQKRFRAGDNQNIKEIEAFVLSDPDVFRAYNAQYELSQTLYFSKKPSLREILNRLDTYSSQL